ncbi:class Ib ribonucleoside-diphosphate reductase assembly flavoprotein NrdI [Haploplasma axanthum]|nr:class Ib ribonucleoside-diphosphate reductase assembly flavoprotein NrdI [Haploplasma axanthum]
MIVVFDSLTGQSKRFASKLGYEIISVDDYYDEDEEIFLVTRTFNFGQIPVPTVEFLNDYHDRVIGTAVSGNRNWGTNYGKAGDKIRDLYKIPLVLKFEGSGFDRDVEIVKKWIEENKKGV